MHSSEEDLLAELVADHALLEELNQDELSQVLAELERLKAEIWIQLARPSESRANGDELDTNDQMLTVDEASEILGVEKRWLYDRSDSLPFARKLAPRTLRFSKRGLYRWLETRP